MSDMEHKEQTLAPSATRNYQLSFSPAGAGERPQWGQPETAELIRIRGELERDFRASKRNKTLWEIVASRMREKGFFRTSHQCKVKWKNLVNRYKGKETSDPDNGKQCPFFEELHAIFSERANNLQQSFMESQQVAVQPRKKMRGNSGDQFLDELSQDEDDEADDSNEESLIRKNNGRKRKAEREKNTQATARDKTTGPTDATFVDISSSRNLQEILKGFFQQQQRTEMQWREAMEKHHREREMFEQEWRVSMEKLERERLMMEQAWREREEQRKMREEIRAEQRDALLTTLLNKLINEDNL